MLPLIHGMLDFIIQTKIFIITKICAEELATCRKYRLDRPKYNFVESFEELVTVKILSSDWLLVTNQPQ